MNKDEIRLKIDEIIADNDARVAISQELFRFDELIKERISTVKKIEKLINEIKNA